MSAYVPDPSEIEPEHPTMLTAYKRPRAIDLLDELPRSASGKLLRRELRNADAASSAS